MKVIWLDENQHRCIVRCGLFKKRTASLEWRDPTNLETEYRQGYGVVTIVDGLPAGWYYVGTDIKANEYLTELMDKEKAKEVARTKARKIKAALEREALCWQEQDRQVLAALNKVTETLRVVVHDEDTAGWEPWG